jgi:CBS domain containing-hemolysin-like protein
LLLIAAHAFFVAGEFGLVAVDRSAIESQAEGGSARARATLAALKTLSFQLSGAQFGITVTSLLVGFLTEPAIAPVLEPLVSLLGLPGRATLGISITGALVLATTVEMVVAELIPKNLAIARPLGMAFATGPPLRLVNGLFRPVILFLNASANWTVRRFGIEPQEELSSVRSLEELELLIRSSKEAGAMMDDEFALLARSISFTAKTAADALVPRTSIVAVTRAETLADLATRALETGHSRFPVIGEDLDDIAGIAHVKDSLRFESRERPSTPISAIARRALIVPESRDLESLLLEMRREGKQMVVVADEYGGTAGILTIEDVLEEIVGEIEDEYDASTAQLTEGVPGGIHVLSGRLHPHEVEEVCGLRIPEGPYDTFAGFLLRLFDRIPEPGDHVSFEGWEFKVVEMDRHRIDKVLVVGPGNEGEG